MKSIRYTLILIFCFCALNAGQEDAERWKQFNSQYTSIVDIAIKSRGHLFDDFSLELSSILTDFSKDNSIHEASLSAYKYLMGDTIVPAMIDIQGFDEPEDGYVQKDIVILFKDPEGDLLMVMKWFRSLNTFINEISAMEKLHSFHLTESDLATPLTVGKAFYNGVPYYLLVETAAKGETIISLVNAIGALPEGEERKEAVVRASQAINAQAKAMAELHIQDGVEKGPEGPPLSIEEIASKLNDLGLSIDDLVPQIKSLENDYFAVSHIARYMLGDANWGNFLYDQTTSKITMIDVNFMNFSLGADGLPIHDATADYSIVMTHFWFLVDFLSDEERLLILNSFDEAYRSAIEDKGPTDLELTFALVSRWAMYARGVLFYRDEVDKEWLEQHTQKLRDICYKSLFNESANSLISFGPKGAGPPLIVPAS